ncbi:MAG TPA: DUF1570 domain-containing protein [Tepidisphaeraceae bacterium]|nr:DUF1570 domain-containing protein [Tepidisphaeraceae bacterium]
MPLVAGVAVAKPPAGGKNTAGAPAEGAAKLRRIETPYYVLHTDVDDATAREAALRVTTMAEEYYERTREFSGTIRERLPFYLFRRPTDYYAAGGAPESDGVFDGERLMAIAGEKAGAATWHVTQHEGFHQFAHAVIGGDLPMWVNEGLAEYFGEAAFTGDGYQSGLVPAWRLKRVRASLNGDLFLPVADLMKLDNAAWNARLAIENYDQAWMMVHFLAHGDGGKYQKPFVRFMKDLVRGRGWDESWAASFGDRRGFERAWRQYWLTLPDNPTADGYARATVATLTSFLARAMAQRQTFATADAFLATAAKGELKADPTQALPPTLLEQAVTDARELGRWSMETPPGGRTPQLVCTRDDGIRLVGVFTLKGEKVERVDVSIDDTAIALASARKLINAGQPAKAKPILTDALKRNPKSPLADEVRKLLQPPGKSK